MIHPDVTALHRGSRIWIGLTLLATFFPATSGWSYFEQSDFGARALGFGKAFTAIADDATAVYWNPAGLAMLDHPEIIFTYARPYEVPGMSAGSGALAVPLGVISGGAAWHHFGVSDVINEDVLAVAAGKRVYTGTEGLIVSVGGALNLYRVAFPSYQDPDDFSLVDFGAETRFTASVGFLARYLNKWSAAYVLRNIGSPEFDFIEGPAGGASVPALSQAGLGLKWNPESTLSVGYQQISPEEGDFNIGGEVWFYDSFAIRAGFQGVDAGGGVSIKAKKWLIDLGFLTNGPLGLSYRTGLKILL